MENNFLGGAAMFYREQLSTPSNGTIALDVKERMEQVKANIYQYIEQYQDNNAGSKEIADKIIEEGREALYAVMSDDNAYLHKHTSSHSLLEAIVRTDGSRPSFLIRNDQVDFNSSPAGAWKGSLALCTQLRAAIQCVGRINRGDQHIGTGFMMAHNIVLTNRHVLQEIGEQISNQHWRLKPETYIDFGYEFDIKINNRRRALKAVLYAGREFIEADYIDHAKLDLAILELAQVDKSFMPPHLLQWNPQAAAPAAGSEIFIIGYPGHPRFGSCSSSLLDRIFKNTYGYKRLAPGIIIPATEGASSWTLTHDATTLGGSSGSLIVTVKDEYVAAGIHYGGSTMAPRQNWGYDLAKVWQHIADTEPAIYAHLKNVIA